MRSCLGCDRGEIVIHPFVIGELLLGYLPKASEMLKDLNTLPKATVANSDEVQGGWHRMCDGGYSLIGSWKAVRAGSGASPGKYWSNIVRGLRGKAGGADKDHDSRLSLGGGWRDPGVLHCVLRI